MLEVQAVAVAVGGLCRQQPDLAHPRRDVTVFYQRVPVEDFCITVFAIYYSTGELL